MKKIKQLLVFLLLVSFTLTCAIFVEHEYLSAAPSATCPDDNSTMRLIDTRSVDPTCTTGGSYYFVCEFPGCLNDAIVEVGPLGHDYNLSDYEEYCLDTGYAKYRCSRCGDSYTESVAAVGHNYVTTTTKKATCTETGTQKSVCSRCNDTKYITLKALGHDWEEEHKDPTCTEEGYDKKTCKRCDEVEETKIPALGHKISGEKTVKEPTCTEDGLKTSECSVCGEKFEEKIPALGHKYPDDWTIEKEASYFSAGLETKTCEMGDDVIEQEIPQKDPTPLVVGGGGVAVAAGAGLFIMNGLKSG